MKRTFNYFPANISIPGDVRIRVNNLLSPRTGEPVKNQFCIRGDCGMPVVFQSYDTVCLKYDRNNKVLTVFPEAFNYSVTTSKYASAFLRDEIGLSSSAIDDIKKLAKRENYSHDCPMYIQL